MYYYRDDGGCSWLFILMILGIIALVGGAILFTGDYLAYTPWALKLISAIITGLIDYFIYKKFKVNNNQKLSTKQIVELIVIFIIGYYLIHLILFHICISIASATGGDLFDQH